MVPQLWNCVVDPADPPTAHEVWLSSLLVFSRERSYIRDDQGSDQEAIDQVCLLFGDYEVYAFRECDAYFFFFSSNLPLTIRCEQTEYRTGILMRGRRGRIP